MMRSSETSCLTALYFRRYNQIKKTCPLMLADKADYAVGVGQSQFVVLSLNGTLVKKMCHGQTEQQVRLVGVHLVNIPSGCMLQMAIADLSPAVDVDADELVQLPLPFEAARFEKGERKISDAAIMKWAKENGGTDRWGHLPRGQIRSEIWSPTFSRVVRILRRVHPNGWTWGQYPCRPPLTPNHPL